MIFEPTGRQYIEFFTSEALLSFIIYCAFSAIDCRFFTVLALI
ncbi:hypothetical protein P20429_1261 [Pseudoalteromonas sp. BSi20429]|nr:hypothetical protein P20429_1261 [Pseudoalteromonas sp. BSi20429]